VQFNLKWLPTLLSNSYRDGQFSFGATFDVTPEREEVDYGVMRNADSTQDNRPTEIQQDVEQSHQKIVKLRDDYEAHLRMMAWTPALQAKWEAKLLRAGLPKEVSPSDKSPDATSLFIDQSPEEVKRKRKKKGKTTERDSMRSAALKALLSGSQGDNDDAAESEAEKHLNSGSDYESHFSQRETTDEIAHDAKEVQQLISNIRKKYEIEERTPEHEAALLSDPDLKQWASRVDIIKRALPIKEARQEQHLTDKSNTIVKRFSRAEKRLEDACCGSKRR
jgi:hypothetical protein